MAEKLELESVTQSDRKNKRFRANFKKGGASIKTHFGEDKFNTYIDHGDEKRKDAYRSRHKKDKIDDPTSAGSLSWHLLWGPNMNLKENIEVFKKKFDV